MSLYLYSLFYLLIACYFSGVLTVPPDYCFAQFNGSDCKLEPTPVFSYYKPGSRCEIQMWRGCPTENKFENEYVCSLNCIFRMRIGTPPTTTPAPVNDCDAILDPNQCANETKTVYTHVNGKCIEAQWGGCETRNKFESKIACDIACDTHQEIDLKKKLEELNEDSLEELNEILKDVIEEETTTEPPTTKAETESPESESQTDSPEVETTTESVETTTNDDYDEVITS